MELHVEALHDYGLWATVVEGRRVIAVPPARRGAPPDARPSTSARCSRDLAEQLVAVVSRAATRTTLPWRASCRPGTPDDDEAAAEFRRLTSDDLSSGKLAQRRAWCSRARRRPTGDGPCSTTPRQQSWLRTLTDLRLTLGGPARRDGRGLRAGRRPAGARHAGRLRLARVRAGEPGAVAPLSGADAVRRRARRGPTTTGRCTPLVGLPRAAVARRMVGGGDRWGSGRGRVDVVAQSRTGEALGASYRLVELIGSGAVGEVWRATVAPHDEAVAAKLLRPEHAADPEIVERFVRERSVLLSLRHPGVVQVRDLVVEGDRLAIVMDLVPGGSVRDVVAATGPLAPADALAVAAGARRPRRGARPRRRAPRRQARQRAARRALGDRAPRRRARGRLRHRLGRRRGPRHDDRPARHPSVHVARAHQHRALGPRGRRLRHRRHALRAARRRTPFAGPGTDFTIAYRHVTSTPPPLDLPDDLDAALASLLAKDPAARPAAADAASRLRRLAERHAELAVLPRVDAPEAFAEVERPATIVRGSTTTRGPAGPIPADPDVADPETAGHDDGPGVPEARPDLGTDGAHTVVRPLRRPEGGAVGAAPRRAAPPAGAGTSSSWRPAWLTNRVAVVGGTAAALVAAVIVAAVVLVPRGPAEPAVAGGAVAATASQRDAALPTGLTVTRDASYDPERGSVDLTLTYSAQAAPLSGAVLEVVPGLDEGDPCPAVTWTAPASVERDRPSLSGVTADCGWAVDLDVPAGDELVVEGTVPVSPADGAALDAWLDAAGQSTAEAVEDPAVTGTSYVVQRLRGVEVRTPSRTVSQTTLPVTLVPVWPSGPDELNPLYSSPSTGAPSSMLDDVAGGEGGVRFADGCSGALAVRATGSSSRRCRSPRSAWCGRRWARSRTSRVRPSASRPATERAVERAARAGGSTGG